jgi:lauroyl/myristoyl acyltransferase
LIAEEPVVKAVEKFVYKAERQLAKRAVSSPIPIRTHIGFVRLRGRFGRILSGISPHVLENMHTAFDQQLDLPEIDAIARRHVEFSKQIPLMVNLTGHSGFARARPWEVMGVEHLEAAVSRGKGTILISGHFGYIRMIGPMLHAEGYDTATVRVMGRGEQGMNERVQRYKGHEIPAGLDIRPIVNALAENKLVVIAGDGLRSSEFVRLNLLGMEYPFPTGCMKIAMLTGATVLPTFALDSEGDRACRVQVLPPLRVDQKGSAKDIVSDFARLYDDQLLSAPHLWHRWGIKKVFTRAIEWSESEDRWNRGFGR